MSGVALASGYAADVAFGDPRRFHPVAGFGKAALAAERASYAPTRARGAIYAGVLVTATALVAELAARRLGRGRVLAAVTWAALGGSSLVREGRRVARHVDAGELDRARDVLPSLCGRDPQALSGEELCRATVESLAENTADAVVGPLLWGALGGPAGVVAYRAANTLDAMVGHRSERYRDFGWAAARLDDAMNWPVARASAALTVACAPLAAGSPGNALRTWRKDGASHPSPNAGRVESAFAGALGVRLGGPLSYNGQTEIRPVLGDGPAPSSQDVRRAARLSLAVGASAAAIAVVARSLR
jgi:adenosylcobinamide-phosphate synthase